MGYLSASADPANIGKSAKDIAGLDPSFSFGPGTEDWLLTEPNHFGPAHPDAPATAAPAGGDTGGGGGLGSGGIGMGGGGGGGGTGKAPVPAQESTSTKAIQGLTSAMQGPGAGWQQTGISPGQMDLGTRTPPVALDILRQVVAQRGRAY